MDTDAQIKQLILSIESSVTSLLTDDEICVALDIDHTTLMQHYDVVERARLKLKQKINAKRIITASQMGKDVDQLLWDIPQNDYRRKHPKTAVKTVEGVLVGRGETSRIISPDEVFKLAKLGCSLEEMSEWFDVPRETLKYNFRDLIAKGRQETKQALRRAQIKVALGGNTSMLIWLGKQMLEQTEQINHTQGDPAPLPWVERETKIDNQIHLDFGKKSNLTAVIN